ncbi:MAG: cytosine deaminase [Betaproteobacteria bacterium]|nr:cytosine deaminase [Betaproteobacteria bacterium]
MAWPVTIPAVPHLVLANAAVPAGLLGGGVVETLLPGAPDSEGLVRVDIAFGDGRIAGIAVPGAQPAPAEAARVDLAGAQAWPCFVDMHTHLDKGHIWPRAENPDGTFAGALASTGADRAVRWSADDVRTRMRFGLRAAYAHGTTAIRTHLDSLAPQAAITWPVFAALREEWRGRIDLQAVSILLLEHFEGPAGDALADRVAAHGGVLGGVALPSPALAAQLDRVFALAAARGLDLDFHADETGDPGAAALRAIAEAALRHRFAGSVVVGHCCSLAVQPPGEVDRTLDLVAAARLAIVSLPMCNLYLQDRTPGRTPRWRGVTLLHEMRARGIAVAVASDNCRDPFYGYGDQDMLEVFTQAARIAHLDRPIGAWPAAVTRTPAEIMGLGAGGRLETGAPADLVLFNARGYSELLSRPQSDRIVLRAGKAIDTTLPDYRELDPLMADAQA